MICEYLEQHSSYSIAFRSSGNWVMQNFMPHLRVWGRCSAFHACNRTRHVVLKCIYCMFDHFPMQSSSSLPRAHKVVSFQITWVQSLLSSLRPSLYHAAWRPPSSLLCIHIHGGTLRDQMIFKVWTQRMVLTFSCCKKWSSSPHSLIPSP